MGTKLKCLTVFAGLLALFILSTSCQDQLTVIPGDVVFGGFFDVNELENGACGKFIPESVHAVVAVTWFLQSLNNRNYIPGFKIGFDVFRTCSSTERSVDGALKLVNDYRVGDAAYSTKVLFGLLGPERTEGVKFVSRWLSSLPDNKRLFQISGSATGMELSNNALYPNFFRVIPSDTTQVKVMEQLLVQLGWNYFAIAYDSYGSSVAKELWRFAKDNGICVPIYAVLPDNTFDRVALDIVNNMSSLQNGLVRGIVIVASSSSLQRLIKKLDDNKHYVNLVLGEAVGLQQRNVQSTTGQILSIARGALVTSPPYFLLPEFQSFWKDLWTNQTLFTDYAKIIPWLTGLYDQVKNSGEKTVSLYTGYHLKAVAVMAAFLKQQNMTRCLNTSLCPNLIKLITNRTSLLQTLADTVISLSEFRSEIAEFENVTSVAFDEKGDLRLKSGNISYAVYNFQQEKDRDYFPKQVATYADDKLTIRELDVVFYSETGSPLTWPQRPLAQCDVKYDCLQCDNDVSDDVLFIPGDFYVVGILPIHERNPSSPLTCGKIKSLEGAELAESLVFAVKEINENKDMFRDILPKRKVGLLVINSCSSPLLVRKRLLDLHTGRLLLSDESNMNSSAILPNIMGYVGAINSGESMASADTLKSIGRSFVQVSAASTATYLKDREIYPFFMRLVPADDIQAKILLDVAVKLNSTYIQIIYDQTLEYAKGLVHEIEEALKTKFTEVCIAQKIEISPSVDVSTFNKIKDKLRIKSFARLVIVILDSTEIAKIMNAILPELTEDDNFLFLASDSWGRQQDLIQGKTKLEGSLVFSLENEFVSSFDSYFRSLDPTQAKNVWLRYFWETKKNCYFEKGFERKGKSGPCPKNISAEYVSYPGASLHIQAVYALVIGFNQTLSQKCTPFAERVCDALKSEHLFEVMKKVQLDVYNTSMVFDDNGDGLVGFKILQVTRDRSSPVDAVVYKEVGSGNPQSIILNKKDLTLPGGTFSSVCPNPVECRSCYKQNDYKYSSSSTDNSTLPVILGVSLAFAATVIVLLVFVIRLWRRLKAKSREDTTLRYVAGAGRCDRNVQKSGQGSSEADQADHYDYLGNMECHLRYGVLNRDADDKTASHSRMGALPPAPCHMVQKRRTEYLTPWR